MNSMQCIFIPLVFMKTLIFLFVVFFHSLQQQFWISTPVCNKVIAICVIQGTSYPYQLFQSQFHQLKSFVKQVLKSDFKDGGSIADFLHFQLSFCKGMIYVFASCLQLKNNVQIWILSSINCRISSYHFPSPVYAITCTWSIQLHQQLATIHCNSWSSLPT